MKKQYKERTLTRKLNINGQIAEVVTIQGLGKLSNRSTSTMRLFEATKILPAANYRTKDTQTAKRLLPGYRVYTLEAAQQLAKVIKTFKQGVPVTEVQKQKLRDILLEERLKYK